MAFPVSKATSCQPGWHVPSMQSKRGDALAAARVTAAVRAATTAAQKEATTASLCGKAATTAAAKGMGTPVILPTTNLSTIKEDDASLPSIPETSGS